jgi:hypothetical protein
MHALTRGWLNALVRLAPAPAREALLGDLLEEHAVLADAGFAADLWLVRESARSVLPLAAWRLRRAGPARVALAGIAGVAAATAVHAAGSAAWHAVLAQVPFRAFHDAPTSWRVIAGCLEAAAALAGAALVVLTGIARRGGRT